LSCARGFHWQHVGCDCGKHLWLNRAWHGEFLLDLERRCVLANWQALASKWYYDFGRVSHKDVQPSGIQLSACHRHKMELFGKREIPLAYGLAASVLQERCAKNCAQWLFGCAEIQVSVKC